MKILFHLQNMARGGAERVVNILSSEFAQLGHEVVIATEDVAAAEYTIHDKVRRIHAGLQPEDAGKSRIVKIALRYIRLREVLKAQKPDVVISFCNKANFRSSIAVIGLGMPLIVSVRNDPAVDYRPYRVSTWIMERIASGCVFQTPDARSFFSKRLQDKSRIILNPLSDQYLEQEFRYSASAPGFSEEKRILCIGRITPQKNILMLIRAFEAVSSAVPEAKLMIFGGIQDQSYAEKLEDTVRNLGLEDRIRFMGLTADVAGELKKAYMYVLSSDYEGMPNALLEAMAMGVPCISTDCPCGGPRMMIKNGESGLLVPVSDESALSEAMIKLLTDPDLADRLALNAGKIRHSVLPGQVASQWLDFIEQCRK